MRPDVLEQWPLISRLLDEALALDLPARRAWLDALPAGQAELKPMLQRLLARREEAASFFANLPAEGEGSAGAGSPGSVPGTATGLFDAGSTACEGMEIGPYRLERQLGRGGMGTVWLARRTDGAVGLPVAIKLPDLEGGDARSAAERFERERQILATLNHPNIARLYEAGLSAGRPYLALEYVEGETLLAWCERRALPVRKRLELFQDVLRAVQYAHASLVIHRDLKPSNIIVTQAGTVKLLDFGIAKLLDPGTRSSDRTQLTRMYGRPMTLDYASPEQVLGEPLTTSTDVYSLGVVLFELLCGSRPYRLKRGSAAELEEAILTGAEVRPSQAVTEDFASTVSSSLAGWRRALRGDLDTVVLKALEKDRAARYESVHAFAEDCERFLKGLPVLAKPQRPLYRFGKFVGRHRLALGAATAVALALIVGLGAALWQARVASEEALKQRAVQSFLTSLFDKNTRLQPDAAQARSMTVRELLLDAGDRVQSGFEDTPSVKLELLNTVARLLREIDEFERSADLSRKAIELARREGFTASDAYVEALMSLATAARLNGNAPEAVQAREESLRILDERGDDRSLLRARADINTIAQMAPDAAHEIALVEHGAGLFERYYPAEPAYFNALWVLGNLNRTNQSPAAAAQYFERAIAVFDRVGSRDYTNYAASHGFLAQCEFSLGRVGAALDHYAKGLELLDRHAGPTALTTRFHRGNYAAMLYQAGRAAEARRVFEQLKETRPEGKPSIVEFDDAVYEAFGLLDEGRAREAQRLLDAFSANWVEFGRRYPPNGVQWVAESAMSRALQGQPDQARAALARIGELAQQHYGRSLETSSELVAAAMWVEMSADDIDKAAERLGAAKESLRQPPDTFDWAFVQLATYAAEVQAQRGQTEDAVRTSAMAVAHLRDKADRSGFPYLEARALKAQGDALVAAGRTEEGISSLEAALELMRRFQSPDSPWLLDSLTSLSLAHSRLPDRTPARPLAVEARDVVRRQPVQPALFLRRLAEAERLAR